MQYSALILFISIFWDNLYIKITLNPLLYTNVYMCIFFIQSYCHSSYLRLSDYYRGPGDVGIFQLQFWAIVKIQVIIIL